MHKKRGFLRPSALLVVVAVLAAVLWSAPASTAAGDVITSPDTVGDVGFHTSLALDRRGNPVVSYLDATNADLKVLHCGDASCITGNVITSPDTVGDVGFHTSLALDRRGNPVVSYLDNTNGDLKVLHCGDANCSAGNVIMSPDTVGHVGRYTSLALDRRGNPVVSYFDVANADLKVLHCGDVNCSTGNVITSPDTTGNVGQYTSLALDGRGDPVVSYYDGAHNYNLKVLHCGDVNCSTGNVITSPDTVGLVGKYTSLALDGSGKPVVGYYDGTSGNLKVLHCGDPNCGSGNVVTSPDTAGMVGQYPSLALDGSGNPVVSYYAGYARDDLRVLRCGDPTCGSGNVVTSPDTVGRVGQSASLALDTAGQPVVSYYDATNRDLKLLHCGDANCSDPPPEATPGAVGLVAIDTTIGGNDDTMIGTIDPCASINVGDTLTLDLIVQGVHAADRIAGYQIDIDYDPSIISVTSVVDVDDSGSLPPNDVTILSRIASVGGLGYLSLSDTASNPYSMTLSAIDATASPAPPGNHESGDGVLARVTVIAVGNGVTSLDVGGPLGGVDGLADVIINKDTYPFVIPVTIVQDGAIAVGQFCPLSPAEVPDPNCQISPGRAAHRPNRLPVSLPPNAARPAQLCVP